VPRIEELDLSKGALYEMIRPLTAGMDCPACGTEVVHSNRTAKERARVDCPGCGWDGTEDEAVQSDPRTRVRSGATRRAPSAPGPRQPAHAPDDDLYPEDDFDVTAPLPARATSGEAATRRLVTGGALLGAAVGLALVIWARRR